MNGEMAGKRAYRTYLFGIIMGGRDDDGCAEGLGGFERSACPTCVECVRNWGFRSKSCPCMTDP